MEDTELMAMLDELSDTEVGLDLIIAEKETLKNKQIPLEIQAELEAIDAEYAPKIETMKSYIEARKKHIQALLKENAKPIKSKFYNYSYEEEVVWDAKALDGYALSHPEILWMRNTKPKTRLTPKKGEYAKVTNEQKRDS